MKYIVPLYSQPSWRQKLGSVNWDTFQAGFRIVMRGDKFIGVTWDPWWHERDPNDRRKGDRRRSDVDNGLRFCLEGEIAQRLRLGPDPRGSIHQRPVRNPKSASRKKLISFVAVIRGLGKAARSDENARLLIRMWAGLTTREVYDSWKRNSGMVPYFRVSSWDERQNREKFTEYAVASFLDLLRPGVIYWKGESPSVDGMTAISRISRVFVRATPSARLQAVRDFVEAKVELEGMRKVLSGETLTDKKDSLQLVWAYRKLKPKAFYEKLCGPLSDLGIALSSKPNSYRKQIERLMKDAKLYAARLLQ